MALDEASVLLASVLLVASAGIRFYARLLRRTITPWKAVLATRLLLGALPVVLLGALGVTLRVGAAREVREHSEYILLFVALGAAWLDALSRATGWLGIDLRDDAVERNNTAAAIAASGALAGGMIVYACANLGEGDTIWSTIGPASLATALSLALWAAHQTISDATDAITLDRDVASGIRFAGMTLGTSLVIGRAVAGHYASAFCTVRDLFVRGWPAVPLAVLSAVIQVKLRPTKARPKPSAMTRGLVPALAYLAIGIFVLRCGGAWSRTGATQ